MSFFTIEQRSGLVINWTKVNFWRKDLHLSHQWTWLSRVFLFNLASLVQNCWTLSNYWRVDVVEIETFSINQYRTIILFHRCAHMKQVEWTFFNIVLSSLSFSTCTQYNFLKCPYKYHVRLAPTHITGALYPFRKTVRRYDMYAMIECNIYAK